MFANVVSASAVVEKWMIVNAILVIVAINVMSMDSVLAFLVSAAMIVRSMGYAVVHDVKVAITA